MRRSSLITIAAAVLAAGLLISYSAAQEPAHEAVAQVEPPAPAPTPDGQPPSGPGHRGGPAWPGGPRGMGGPMGPGGPGADPDRTGETIGLVGKFRMLCSEPEMAAIFAISAMQKEVRRKPADVIKDYEDLLAKTKSLTLRNTLRLALKDLYRAAGEDEKVLELLRTMVAENDAAIQARPKPPQPEKSGEKSGER